MSDSKRAQAMPTGPERELQIYALGLSGGKPSVPVPVHLLEERAKEILAPRAHDYVAGGAGGEDTMRANREAFYGWRIVPRMLRDVSKRDVSVELFGARLPAPGLLAPLGERDLDHGYLPFMLGQGLANYFSDPVFRGLLAQPPEQNPAAAIQLWGSVFSNTALTWKDIAFLRQQTRVPIVLKGILHSNDAGRALDAGLGGLIVSNHGGRQGDGARG